MAGGARRVRGRGRRQQPAVPLRRHGRSSASARAASPPATSPRNSPTASPASTLVDDIDLDASRGARLRARPMRSTRARIPATDDAPRRADRRRSAGTSTIRADGIEYWLTDAGGKKLLVETGWKPGMTLAIAPRRRRAAPCPDRPRHRRLPPALARRRPRRPRAAAQRRRPHAADAGQGRRPT